MINDLNDLISRSALKEATKCFTDCDGFNPVWQVIDNAPTVEINTNDIQYVYFKRGYELGKEKRPHGEWIICNQDNEGIHKIECPLCKYVCGSDFGDQIIMTFQKLPNYCENCGAKMDGGNQNETN